MEQYEYTPCELNESQYDDINLEENKIVDAVYVKAVLDFDRGNRYIEALPYPRSEEAVRYAYTKTLPTYRYDDVKNLSKLEKMLQVSSLRQLRFPLTFHKTLEFNFYNAITTSYRARMPLISRQSNVKYTTEDEQVSTNTILCGSSSDATNAGFSLIGYSGCGKSSSIHTLLSRYPQVIMHRRENGSIFPQITYLVVNCTPNSNFSALYAGIGDAIDKALGNTIPVYSREINKEVGLGRKAEKIKRYIEMFGIGIIIFDEIQLIDFNKTRDSTFESLMTLSNQTKVAMAVVGTEDARDKMFKELRTSRRLGTMVNGNMYCDNKNFFEFLVSQLFQYQWFDEPVELTQEIIDALYDVTKGIVDQLIGIYSCMHYDYLEKKKRPVVDGAYIYEVAHKYYPGIQNVLADLEQTECAKKLMDIRSSAQAKMNDMLDAAKQEAEAESMIAQKAETAAQTVNLRNVVSNIMAIYDDYAASKIERTFYEVLAKPENASKSEKEITRMVIDRLRQKTEKKKRGRPKLPAVDTSHMQDFLGKEKGIAG